MGFTQDIFDRVSKFFARDKERANIALSKGATSERMDASALDILTSMGFDALSSYLRLDQDLLNRFADYEEMDDYGEISTALDIMADDSTQPDTTINRTIWVTSKDRTLQQNLDDLINRTLRLDEELWEIARTLSKYGNDYEEILATNEGVRGLNYLPPATMRRMEGHRGELLGFVQDFSGKFDFTTNDFHNVLAAKLGGGLQPGMDLLQHPIAAFEGWEVVHFRLRGRERRSVYGHSMLESARWIWKRLMLLEDAALVYRLQRAPERFAFYVDTGDLPPNESLAFVNRVRQNFRKKKFVDPSSGKLNLKFDAISPDEDFFIPTRKGVDSTRIENLGSPQWQAMDDVEYFRDKLFAAIKVPKAYLGQEQGVARAVLSSEDVRFARTVLRIQRELKNGVRKICRVHLSALNKDPYAVDYDLHMTVPSAIFELAQMEVRNARADLAARMKDFVSLEWVLARVFEMSEAEIKVIMKQRRGEMIADAKTQADAQTIMEPPMPEEEAPPEEEGGGEEGGEAGAEERRILRPEPSNPLTERLTRARMRGVLRGVPTRSGITEQELFEFKQTARRERQQEEKLAQLLENDRGLALHLKELGGLLRDIKMTSARRK